MQFCEPRSVVLVLGSMISSDIFTCQVGTLRDEAGSLRALLIQRKISKRKSDPDS